MTIKLALTEFASFVALDLLQLTFSEVVAPACKRSG